VRNVSFALACVLTVATAREASAQQSQPPPQDPNAPVRVLTQRPPYQGIFGGGVGRTSQLLTLGLNMGGGFDSSVFVDDRNDPNAVAPVGRRRSGFVQGSANLSYTLSLTGVSFAAGVGASGSWYPKLDRPAARRYYGNLGGGWSISRRASLGGNYSVAYRPINHLVTLPGLDESTVGPNDPFDSVLGAQSETYRTEQASVDFNYRLSERIGTSFRYGNWRVVSPDRDHDVSTNGGTARMSFTLTKSVGVYAGYRFDSGDYHQDETIPRYTTHGADFGLDFAKALSLTRKTTMSFGVGTTAATDGNRTQYALTGHVNVNREIARTWHANVTYRRDVGFAETFRLPVFSDSVTSRVSGLVTRRLRFDAGLSAAFGSVGFSSDANTENGYRSIYASAGLGFGMSRKLSGGVRYSYTRHRFESGIQSLPTDLVFQSGRHGVNVYLSSWIPLFSRTRRP
jgi:hypothetical protein